MSKTRHLMNSTAVIDSRVPPSDATTAKRQRRQRGRTTRPTLTLRPDGLYADWWLCQQHYVCHPRTLKRRREKGLVPQHDLYHGEIGLTRGSTIIEHDRRLEQQTLARREAEAAKRAAAAKQAEPQHTTAA